MHRLIAVLMSLLWLLNAVSASAFMSAVEKDDGGFLVPICSGGQIIFLDLSDAGPAKDGDPGEGAPDAAHTIDCPLLTATTILPELFAQSHSVEHRAIEDTLRLRSRKVPAGQAADRPGARGPPTLF